MNSLKLWTDRNLKGDPIIWFIVFAFSIISLLVVYSATGTLAYRRSTTPEAFLVKHGALIVLGLLAVWVSHKIDYRYYSKLSRFALWASVPLLLYAYFFGTSVNEASRWITIPIINQSFQPSDLAKLALIANVASMLSKRQLNIADFKEALIPVLIWCGAICGLIALTNFSTAVLLFATCMLLMFIGRVPVKYLALLVLIGVLAGSMALVLGQRGNTVISRIKNYINPVEIPFQQQQSYIAIATGGIIGKGAGHSDQRNRLPFAESDYIYSIIVEEYGMMGGISVLFLYLALLYRGMIAVANSERAFGGLLSAGVTFALVIQAMVNIGVAVGLLPVTGQPLPMISMGGTSLLFTGLSVGIVLSVSKGEVDEISLQSTKGGGKGTIAKAA